MKKITTLLFAITLLSATYVFASKENNNNKTIVALADSIDLNEYVGKFKLAEGSPVESVSFVIKEGKLVGIAGEYPETILAVKIKDKFEDSGMGGVFTFTRTDGKVDKVKIEVQGFELIGTRVEETK